jgi:hypothetical protein
MDWIHLDLQIPQSLTIDAPRVSPASPSAGSTEAPGFSVRRQRSAPSRLAAELPLLPHTLRFPEPATYWTA